MYTIEPEDSANLHYAVFISVGEAGIRAELDQWSVTDVSIWDDPHVKEVIETKVDGYWTHRILLKVINDRLHKNLEYIVAFDYAKAMLGKQWVEETVARCELALDIFLEVHDVQPIANG